MSISSPLTFYNCRVFFCESILLSFAQVNITMSVKSNVTILIRELETSIQMDTTELFKLYGRIRMFKYIRDCHVEMGFLDAAAFDQVQCTNGGLKELNGFDGKRYRRKSKAFKDCVQLVGEAQKKSFYTIVLCDDD